MAAASVPRVPTPNCSVSFLQNEISITLASSEDEADKALQFLNRCWTQMSVRWPVLTSCASDTAWLRNMTLAATVGPFDRCRELSS